MFHVVCLLGLKVLGGQIDYPCTEPSIKIPSSLIMFSSVSSISSTMQDILLQKSPELKRKWRVEKIFRKGKRVLQSHGQASKNLVLAQSKNSGQVLCHFVIKLVQQHRVILHTV